MKGRLLAYLDKINFFSPMQFGFRSGLSTEDALLDFCSFIYKAIDERKSCASLFVDITKAFDMVDHTILLSKLNSAGFRGNILRWFESYLTKRVQKVKIENYLSEPRFITLGVPQGSVLGPILFLIYINSVFSLPFIGKVTAFADDLAIAYGSDNSFNLFVDINHDLHLLRSWFAGHKLVASNKTKLMYFSLGNKDIPNNAFTFHASNCMRYILCSNNCTQQNAVATFYHSINCNNNCFNIEVVPDFKYLGVIIDQSLSWSSHISAMKLYLLSAVRSFYSLKNCAPTNY